MIEELTKHWYRTMPKCCDIGLHRFNNGGYKTHELFNYLSIVNNDISSWAIINDRHPGFKEDYLLLHALLYSRRPNSVLEIGTHTGLGTSIICNAVGKSCDVFSMDLPEDKKHLSEQWPEHMPIGHECNYPYTQIHGDSRFYKYKTLGHFDAFYIDGEHTEEHVARETQGAIVCRADLIIYHDCDIPEVWKGVVGTATDLFTIARFPETRIGIAVRKKQ